MVTTKLIGYKGWRSRLFMKVNKVHPPWTTSICAKFNCIQFSSCWDISVKTKSCKLTGITKRSSYPLGTMNICAFQLWGHHKGSLHIWLGKDFMLDDIPDAALHIYSGTWDQNSGLNMCVKIHSNPSDIKFQSGPKWLNFQSICHSVKDYKGKVRYFCFEWQTGKDGKR